MRIAIFNLTEIKFCMNLSVFDKRENYKWHFPPSIIQSWSYSIETGSLTCWLDPAEISSILPPTETSSRIGGMSSSASSFLTTSWPSTSGPISSMEMSLEFDGICFSSVSDILASNREWRRYGYRFWSGCEPYKLLKNEDKNFSNTFYEVQFSQGFCLSWFVSGIIGKAWNKFKTIVKLFQTRKK